MLVKAKRKSCVLFLKTFPVTPPPTQGFHHCLFCASFSSLKSEHETESLEKEVRMRVQMPSHEEKGNKSLILPKSLNFYLFIFCSKEGCLKIPNCSWIKPNTNNPAKQLKAQIMNGSKSFPLTTGVVAEIFFSFSSFFLFSLLACLARR